MASLLTTLLSLGWRDPRVLVLLAIAALAAAAALGATGSAMAQGAGACWTPAELAYRPGDEKIQKRIRNASIAPPQRVARRLHAAAPARHRPTRQASARQEADRADVRSLRAAVRDRRLSGRHRRLSAQESHQGHVLHRRQMDAVASRPRAATDVGRPVRGRQPCLGAPQSAQPVRARADRRGPQRAARLRAGAGRTRSEAMRRDGRPHAGRATGAAAARPVPLPVRRVQPARRWPRSPNKGSCRFNGTCRPAIRHSVCPRRQ